MGLENISGQLIERPGIISSIVKAPAGGALTHHGWYSFIWGSQALRCYLFLTWDTSGSIGLTFVDMCSSVSSLALRGRRRGGTERTQAHDVVLWRPLVPLHSRLSQLTPDKSAARPNDCSLHKALNRLFSLTGRGSEVSGISIQSLGSETSVGNRVKYGCADQHGLHVSLDLFKYKH